MRLYLLFFILLFSVRSWGQDLSVYEAHLFKTPMLNLPYRLLRPIDKQAFEKYPLLIFLHGAFEKGFDNEKQLEIGGHFFLRDSIRRNYPAFVLFPQCPGSDSWAYFETETDSISGALKNMRFPLRKTPTDVSSALILLIDSLLKSGEIDPGRIYIGGLSQGAMGVLDLIARYPGTFVAAFSICGAGNPAHAKNFAGKTSLWLFHGEKDDVIPVHYSLDYFKRLKKLNADVRYSGYPGVFHNSWNAAFNEPDLMRWLFSRIRQ